MRPADIDNVPLSGTLSDNNNTLPTDSVYGTPPDPIPTVPPPPATASPTGRQPRLLWTATRQATWNRMVAERHPRWLEIQAKCDRARAGSPAYGDRGLWCTLVYQMSGDVSAARTAWQIVAPSMINPPTSANDIRENFIENALLFDWLYPALTPSEQAQAIAGLNSWGNYALAIGTSQYEGGMRTGDSDAMVGYYFGLAATDLATRGMTGHVDWLSATQTGGPGTLPVGGLRATAPDRSTARNTIDEFVTSRARGGQWIESSDYDPGTVALLIMGTEAVPDPDALQDDFDDVHAFARAAIDFNIHAISEDLQTAVQWGDVQHPREFVGRLYKTVTMLGMLAGSTEGTVESGRAMGLIDALAQRYDWQGYNSVEPNARFYLLYDPYAPRAAWQANPGFVADGRGHLLARTPSTLFSGMMIPPTGVDHGGKYLSDFQLYRNGEWVITHPLGYAGPTYEGESVNGLLDGRTERHGDPQLRPDRERQRMVGDHRLHQRVTLRHRVLPATPGIPQPVAAHGRVPAAQRHRPCDHRRSCPDAGSPDAAKLRPLSHQRPGPDPVRTWPARVGDPRPGCTTREWWPLELANHRRAAGRRHGPGQRADWPCHR